MSGIAWVQTRCQFGRVMKDPILGTICFKAVRGLVLFADGGRRFRDIVY